MEEREMQLSNASSSIVVSPSGRKIEERAEQFINVPFSIVVRFLGREIERRDVHS